MFSRKRHPVLLDCGTEEMTKQSHKDECDIHSILRQYQKTGIITHISNIPGSYEDLPDHHDYQQALNTLNAAESAFAELPSKVRDAFSNDPRALLAALNDPAQAEALRELGILKAVEAPQKHAATGVAGGAPEGAGA